jgi:HK97 family phage major capsid protein
MNRIQEIEARLAEIRADIEKRGAAINDADLSALETEVGALTEERAALIAAAEKRRGILAGIAEGTRGLTVRAFAPAGGDEHRTAADPADPRSAPEYRAAWLKQLRRIPLSEAEQRAYSNAAGAGAEVIPTQTANEILTKVKKLAPMLGEVTLLHVKGAVKYAVEGANAEAAIHAENAAITPAADTLTYVSLSGFEIIKLIQISDTVMTMSIAAFEGWLTDMLAESIARKIESLLIAGAGGTEAKGIDSANAWDDTNSVTVGAAASLTAANVQALIGLLPSGYDANAKFVMSKRTLFTDFMPLQDSSKNHIVTVQGNGYFVYGYPVLTSDYVPAHTAYLGDFRKVVANLPEDINVKNAYDINTNSYKYSGVAIFDAIPAMGEAFVKLAKGA